MVKLDKIYTRGGDSGMSGLTDGSRRSKADLRFAAIGAVDEANSAIGVARLAAGPFEDAMLARIQNDLFDLGADLSLPEGGAKSEGALRIVAVQVTRLENEIDAMNARLQGGAADRPSPAEIDALESRRETFNARVSAIRDRASDARAALTEFNRQVERYNLMLVYPDGLDESSLVTAKADGP